MEDRRETFGEWAVLELMGHRKLGGFVQETTLAGAPFIRIDVPGEDGGPAGVTQFYSPASVYCITPTTEAVARALARGTRPTPVQRYELPAPEEVPESLKYIAREAARGPHHINASGEIVAASGEVVMPATADDEEPF